MSIMLLKEFAKLDANIDMIKKNVNRAELDPKIMSTGLNIKILKAIYYHTNGYIATKITK